ncbi:MAG: WYL domain-containing protein [Myxococcales bacterium]|nr:WYL domain-containing protein [Myxococcales bacterium]
MNRTDRLFAIHSALQTAGSRGRTAAWLAERFEVSTRTIKRDVAALVQSGVPVLSQDGRGGGYQLARQVALAPVSFTSAEATAVAIALASEPQLPFAADGEAALQKLLGAMSVEQRGRAAEVAGRVWMRRDPEERRSKSARVLDEGLRTQVVVHIDYTDGEGKTTSRRPIEPMAFARTRHHWHVLAYCHQRKAGRWFRLDRVRSARLTRTPVAPRELAATLGPAPPDAQPVRLPT